MFCSLEDIRKGVIVLIDCFSKEQGCSLIKKATVVKQKRERMVMNVLNMYFVVFDFVNVTTL